MAKAMPAPVAPRCIAADQPSHSSPCTSRMTSALGRSVPVKPDPAGCADANEPEQPGLRNHIRIEHGRHADPFEWRLRRLATSPEGYIPDHAKDDQPEKVQR